MGKRNDAISTVPYMLDALRAQEELYANSQCKTCRHEERKGDESMTNQEAIASLKTLCDTCNLFPRCVHEKPECVQAIELAISALNAPPEIVRCKDCEHRDPEDKKCDSGHSIQWQLPRSDDWFCADAERKTE